MSKILSLLVGFSLFAFPLYAQGEDEPVWTGSHGYKGFEIHTGHGTFRAGGSDWGTTNNETGGTKQDQGVGLYRYVTFLNGTTILYELKARPLPDREREFEVTIGPYVPTAKQAASWKIDTNSIETRFLQKYRAPLIVKDSEVIAVEIAENPKTGQKLVDYYAVSKGKPLLRTNLESRASQARDFRVEDVELSVFDYDLRRNGTSIYQSTGGCGGRYVSINIPDVGRFFFTLTPPPADAGFERIALVKDGQLWFRHGEDSYEWLSRGQIVPGSGLFHVWMRVDPPNGTHGVGVGASTAPPTR